MSKDSNQNEPKRNQAITGTFVNAIMLQNSFMNGFGCE